MEAFVLGANEQLDDDDSDIEEAVAVGWHPHAHAHARAHVEANAPPQVRDANDPAVDAMIIQVTDSISPYLYRMMQEDCTCKSILAISRRESSCDRFVQSCRDHPEQVFYVSSSSGRTPFLEACLRGHCRHVIAALLEANPHSAFDRDVFRNTPLHLLFVDATSIIKDPNETQHILRQILDLNSRWFGSATNNKGDTILHKACSAPEAMIHPDCITTLLRMCPETVTSHNDRNQTPLTLHCRRANASVEVARLLLEADVGMLRLRDTEKGWSPIHYAAAQHNCPLLQYIIHKQRQDVSIRTSRESESALHLLFNSGNIRNCPVALVQAYLDADPSALTHPDTVHSKTPLHLLCQRSANLPVDFIAIALAVRRNAASVADSNRYLPIHFACEVGASPQIIRLLLDAYPESAHLMTRKQDTPLSLACSANQSVETIKMLIEANPDALTRKNDYGYAPIHCVCRAYQPRMGIVEALVVCCPQCVALKTNAGETAMHLASSNSGAFVGILKLLNTALHIFEQQWQETSDTTRLSRDSRLALSMPSRNVSLVRQPGTTQHQDSTAPATLTSGALASTVAVPSSLMPSSAPIIATPSAGESLNGTTATSTAIHPTAVPHQTDRFETSAHDTTKMTNKVGNTPLHDACFRGTSFEMLETLAMSNPKWINVRNVAGYTPLQILIKCGRLDERIVVFFSQLGGPEIFSILDLTGNTPLHSAMRNDIDVTTVRCLIQARPEALHMKTVYGDTPLHLACFRLASPEVVREVVIAGSNSRNSPVLVPNAAGQTPISIAMEEFQSCGCGCRYRNRQHSAPEQSRPFQILAILVKVLFYGTMNFYKESCSLVRACLSLHRQNIRLDPAFIRQVIYAYPGEVKLKDEQGGYPLHIEASIPVEKMSLLDSVHACSDPSSHERASILRVLLEMHPKATTIRNEFGEFPLGLMIQNGRQWGHAMALALRSFPQALHWCGKMDNAILPTVLEKAGRECGINTLYVLLCNWPGFGQLASENQETENGT